jgi:hypothetical protein
VFTVVDDEEEPATAKSVSHGIDERRTTARGDAQHCRDGCRD